jgi:hypothetical protein
MEEDQIIADQSPPDITQEIPDQIEVKHSEIEVTNDDQKSAEDQSPAIKQEEEEESKVEPVIE